MYTYLLQCGLAFGFGPVSQKSDLLYDDAEMKKKVHKHTIMHLRFVYCYHHLVICIILSAGAGARIIISPNAVKCSSFKRVKDASFYAARVLILAVVTAMCGGSNTQGYKRE